MIDSMIPDADASLKSTKGQHFASIPGFQIMYDTPIMITGFRLYQDVISFSAPGGCISPPMDEKSGTYINYS